MTSRSTPPRLITVNNLVSWREAASTTASSSIAWSRASSIQGGDPDGGSEGGPGYTIRDGRAISSTATAALAMAKTSAPNSAGSQFYITLGPSRHAFDRRPTVFGQVGGREVARRSSWATSSRSRSPRDVSPSSIAAVDAQTAAP